jgi:phosphoglycolate phosphatase
MNRTNKDISIIFDLDGTVVEPKKSITGCINHALKEHGYKEFPIEELLQYIGFGLYYIFPKLVGDLTEEKIWQMICTYREHFDKVGVSENELYPGISEMLEQNKGSSLYIASLKPASCCSKILEYLQLRSLFKGVYGSSEDKYIYDKIDLLRQIIVDEKINFGVMVGDRATDIDAAKKNNLISIGVTYGYGSRKELVDAGSNFVVDSPLELAKVLSTLS